MHGSDAKRLAVEAASVPNLASQMRTAFSSMAWNTGSSSPGELRDDPQHLGGRGLLLQRLGQIVGALAQLVEQPRVLDGDDGLGGEVRDQLDLLVGERPNFLAVDDDRADQLVVLEHRHATNVRIAARRRRHATYDSGSGSARTSATVDRLSCLTTRSMAAPASPGETGSRLHAISANAGGVPLQRATAQNLAVAERHRVPNLASQMPRRILQHRLEHRLQFARRAADDLQHLRGRRLLLQRLGQIARARLHLVEQPHVLDRDHRLVGEGRDQLDLLVGERLHVTRGAGANTPIGVPSRSSGTPSIVRKPPSRAAMRRSYSGSACDIRNVNGFAFSTVSADERASIRPDRFDALMMLTYVGR